MSKDKIFSKHKLARIISSLKKKRKRIVFTNGCFDILHVGHISYLNSAKKLGDILVVGINSDTSVKSLKGSRRPIMPLKDRIKILASLECIDYVCAFSQKTPLNLIKKIRPDVLVKGGDWKNKEIVGADFVKAYGGKIITIPFKKGYSTTGLIKKIISAQK
ncbi:MAG: D-glycero-beta-D-manno-heptose 1-phosphate adenylyltransferase [Candidatus Omnitrophica bacterium]|nr:D-glycero-beta-D-manno-heptose 1-phosphate adenylyltransferase [Candidatus Omnitrophota bacterium]MDD5352295.1 D-glycero-beta-D-manno-heptose 1-phosphate adenylyltransferase [Candidatus Omnitrophota bacterium]MDD5549893.1 D-glycero-beta-D-manno-heptose 1-phosphate adenylyltransferase [Candidatus Omnitrophota bacterium]